jgi:hypothetical protein
LGCVENPSTRIHAQQLEKAGLNGIIRLSQPGALNFILLGSSYE